MNFGYLIQVKEARFQIRNFIIDLKKLSVSYRKLFLFFNVCIFAFNIYLKQMKAIIQRVTKASVTIENNIKSNIGLGLLILLGIEDADLDADITWLVNKICRLRIFDDENGIMNLSVDDIHGEALIVSQFTLHASTKKGNRPSYIKAAHPEVAVPLYKKFVAKMEEELKRPVQTGEFGAMMEVSLVNDGPVTIIIDSKNKE